MITGKIKTIIRNPRGVMKSKTANIKENMYVWLLNDRIYKHLPDKFAIRIKYKRITGRKLHLLHPKTFSEKIQWLKLYNRNLLYPHLVDKFDVRKYIADKLGEEYLVPLYGLYNSPEEIDFACLPDQFVLKCTHDSGSIIICRDKNNFDFNEAKKKLSLKLSANQYDYCREWVYKLIKPRIICEKYLEDESGYQLKDYKIFTFGGIPKLIEVDFNRFINHKTNFYDTDWSRIDISIGYPPDQSIKIEKPGKLEEMLILARKLAEGIPYVRVDLYSVGDKIYFGELTFFPGSGLAKIEPYSFDEILGSWINLPEKIK